MRYAKLRLWPGVVAAVLIVIGFGIGILLTITMPDAALAGILGAMIGTLAVVLWWLFFSRAPRTERFVVFGMLIAAWFATRPFLDRSISGGGMGALPVLVFPVLAVALVSAAPDEFKELARFKAIEGKTWNHPVLVHDILLVRNGEEMAAFRLTKAQ
jgi:hypothetical protein